MTLYLFHLVRQLLDGRRLVCWMDDSGAFWPIAAFESFAKEGPKTWRKLNGVMCVATQSASDVLDSPISRTIIEQTPTKILFPNTDASFEEYIDGLRAERAGIPAHQGASGTRFTHVPDQARHHSVVCQLDLQGFDPQLRVISGRASEVERVHRLIASMDRDPDQWLPQFMGERDHV